MAAAQMPCMETCSGIRTQLSKQRRIKFWKEVVWDDESKPYLRIPHDTLSTDITEYMNKMWKMRSPKVILTVLSTLKNVQTLHKVKNQKAFQQAIMKVANTTEMWIITNGLDMGIAKLIGDAIREEKERRRAVNEHQHLVKGMVIKSRVPKLTVIGVVPANMLRYADKLTAYAVKTEDAESASSTDPVVVGLYNEGWDPASFKYELNPDHTHFIIVDDRTPDDTGTTDLRARLECRLIQPMGMTNVQLEKYLSVAELPQGGPGGEDDMESEVGDSERGVSNAGSSQQQRVGVGALTGDNVVVSSNVPHVLVVGMLIQGSVGSVDMVHSHIKHRLPIIAVKGTGKAADLIAFALEEIEERGPEDSYVKNELSKRMAKCFPKECKHNHVFRNRYRDKIIECVQLSRRADSTFLTVVDMQDRESSFSHLDKYILAAILKAQSHRGQNWRHQLYKDILLTIDWNLHELALTDIFNRDEFSRVKIAKSLFQMSLIKKGRHKFVEIFLEQGFQMHTFLSDRKLRHVYQHAEDPDFFLQTCWINILAYNPVPHSLHSLLSLCSH